MSGWEALIGVIGAVLVALLTVWVREKRRTKEVDFHGGDAEVRADVDRSIDDELRRLRDREAGHDSEAP